MIPRRAYLKKLKLHGFKSFENTEITFSSGINYLAGENNSGKSSIIEAIRYLCSETKYQSSFTPASGQTDGYVRGEFVVGRNKQANEDGTPDEEDLIIVATRIVGANCNPRWYTNGKERQGSSDESKENKKKKVEVIGVMANDAIEKYASLSDSSPLKRLIQARKGSIRGEGPLNDFLENPFNEMSINRLTQTINRHLPKSLNIEIKISDSPDETNNAPEPIIQARSAHTTDGAPTSTNVDTCTTFNQYFVDIRHHGHGVQKAVAFALLQEYAIEQDTALRQEFNRSLQMKEDKEDIRYGHSSIFCIDEPENTLHPRAQQEFCEILQDISATHQVFLATHSPFIIQSRNEEKYSKIFIIKKQDYTNRVIQVSPLSDFATDQKEPSIDEVIYEAFEIPSISYHDELFSRLQNILIGKGKINSKKINAMNSVFHLGSEYQEKYSSILRFDDRDPLIDPKPDCEHNAILIESNFKHEALPVLVRNLVHHPEAIETYKNKYEPKLTKAHSANPDYRIHLLKSKSKNGPSYEEIDYDSFMSSITLKCTDSLLRDSIDLLREHIKTPSNTEQAPSSTEGGMNRDNESLAENQNFLQQSEEIRPLSEEEDEYVNVREHMYSLLLSFYTKHHSNNIVKDIYNLRFWLNDKIYHYPARYTYKTINLIVLYSILEHYFALGSYRDFSLFIDTSEKKNISDLNSIVSRAINSSGLENDVLTTNFWSYWKAWKYTLRTDLENLTDYGRRGPATQNIKFMKFLCETYGPQLMTQTQIAQLMNYLNKRQKAVDE